jgi:hypothetical protein
MRRPLCLLVALLMAWGGPAFGQLTTRPLGQRTMSVSVPVTLASDQIVCPSVMAISQTTTTKVVSGSSGKKFYICSIVLVSDTAQFVNVIEGTGTTCGTGGTALLGSTTAGSGMSFAANGGIAMTAGSPFLVTTTATDDLCVTQSGTGRVSGMITYALL